MGITKKAKITFTCTQEAKDYLKKLAKERDRTLSNLLELLIEFDVKFAKEVQEENNGNFPIY